MQKNANVHQTQTASKLTHNYVTLQIIGSRLCTFSTQTKCFLCSLQQLEASEPPQFLAALFARLTINNKLAKHRGRVAKVTFTCFHTCVDTSVAQLSCCDQQSSVTSRVKFVS